MMPANSNNAPVAMLADVMAVALQVFSHMRRADFTGPSRKRALARPRQVAMALSRELTTASYPKIGRFYGGRDHTTALHAVRRINALCEVDPDLALIVGGMRRLILETIAPEEGPRMNMRERIRRAVLADPMLSPPPQQEAQGEAA